MLLRNFFHYKSRFLTLFEAAERKKNRAENFHVSRVSYRRLGLSALNRRCARTHSRLIMFELVCAGPSSGEMCFAFVQRHRSTCNSAHHSIKSLLHDVGEICENNKLVVGEPSSHGESTVSRSDTLHNSRAGLLAQQRDFFLSTFSSFI
jgi:hypothetical protein